VLTRLSRSPRHLHHTGADIKAVCTEAGLLALRERRMRVTQEDFVKAKEKTLYRKKGNIPEGLYL
jgi:26S proteasome regulatory subunit T2